MSVVIEGEPKAKPRMVRSDKYKKRPCVVKYFAWVNLVRAKLAPHPIGSMKSLEVEFFLPFPKTYSKRKREALANTFHELKPDLDNLVKGICDAGWTDDCIVSSLVASKKWEDEQGARTIIYL